MKFTLWPFIIQREKMNSKGWLISMKSFSRNFSWNWFHGNFHSDYLPTFCCLENYRNAARYENNMVVKMALVCLFFAFSPNIWHAFSQYYLIYIWEKYFVIFKNYLWIYLLTYIMQFPFFSNSSSNLWTPFWPCSTQHFTCKTWINWKKWGIFYRNRDKREIW